MANANHRGRGNQAPAAAAANPAQFSLTPYTAGNGVIDFAPPDGRKFYEKATAPLSPELFDCQPDKLRSFLENLGRRAQAFGWSIANTGITMIPDDLNYIENITKISSPTLDRFPLTTSMTMKIPISTPRLGTPKTQRWCIIAL